ncbi:MAG: TrmH family RNA methyltransferase [Pseudomonadota bacterium]
MVAIALYQPDIPLNVGAAIRLCRCLDVRLHIIEPCGFVWDERRIRQAALDYFDPTAIQRWMDWDTFYSARGNSRIILLTTKSPEPYLETAFQDDDILLLGREGAGVPDTVHTSADGRVTIPMGTHGRSLNIMAAATLVLGEALRQTGHFQTLTKGQS